jgi:hypothetical protein
MGGIINKEKLAELQADIESFRRAIHNVRPDQLVSLAKKLGREKSKKGKHPTYESTVMPERNPLSIPGHRTIKSGTKRSILDELEVDIHLLTDRLDRQERTNDIKRLSEGTIHKGRNP